MGHSIDAEIRFRLPVGPKRRLKRDGWRPLFMGEGLGAGTSAVVTFDADQEQKPGEPISVRLALIFPDAVKPALRRGENFYLSEGASVVADGVVQSTMSGDDDG